MMFPSYPRVHEMYVLTSLPYLLLTNVKINLTPPGPHAVSVEYRTPIGNI